MFGTYCRLHVHVGASAIDVVRAARSRVARRHRVGRGKRAQRHAFYRAMLREHADARALYLHVMKGV